MCFHRDDLDVSPSAVMCETCGATGRPGPVMPPTLSPELDGLARIVVAMTRDRGAVFSECGMYRYALWRVIQENPIDRVMVAVLLNPSTADHEKNDPTVERVFRRARAGGFGLFVVLNANAYRSTARRVLYRLDDPVGPLNDAFIRDIVPYASLTVCGWGVDGARRNRGVKVYDLLIEAGVVPHAYAVTQGGHPQHPLYIPYDATPRPFDRPPERVARGRMITTEGHAYPCQQL